MKLKISIIIVLVSLFTGCASVQKMPLNEEAINVDTSQQSLLFGRIHIQNQNKLNHQPSLVSIILNKDDETYSFVDPTLLSEVPNEGKEYIFSIAADPGEAELVLMRFMRKAFPVIGTADLPFKQKIVIPGNQIVYLGNITAKILPREDGQPRAGSLLPLIDQSVTGLSNGTFVVEVADNFDEDVKLITDQYPFLAGKNITKMILPKWEYPLEVEDTENVE